MGLRGSEFWGLGQRFVTAVGDAERRTTAACGGATMGIGYEGDVEIIIKRSFGGKFFLKGVYTSEEREKPKEWLFQRSWNDFVKLDRAVRKEDPEMSKDVPPVPPEPYILGAEASPEPFQKYLDAVMEIPGAFTSPIVYEFVGAPNSVLAAALEDYAPIDVEVDGELRMYDDDVGPTLDPVMLAAKAGKQYKSVSTALSEAEIAKNSGKAAAQLAKESTKVLGEVGKVVNTKSTGKTMGGVIANLRAGKGIFGEKATMAFTKTVVKTAAEKTGIELPKYTDQDKWTVVISGPGGDPLEVTVKPTQKASVLLKAWKAEVESDTDFALSSGADPATEIGKLIKDNGTIKVIKA